MVRLSDRPTAWTKWLSLDEWWYNNTFHVSTGITPYEALYGQVPPTLVHYVPNGTAVAAAENLLHDRDTILKLLKERLATSQHRMKQFADMHRSKRVFDVGDWVFLKLQPFRQITQKVGPVAYKLDLPPSSKIHPVFYVSLLKKKLISTGVVVQKELPLTGDDGQLQLEPIAILERKLVKRNNRPHILVLVQWSNSIPEDATWENWHDLHQRFPHFQP
ncbi:uncharacterized protein LOC131332555 [Rhododendron vialii]|uniref:uncharacterized protein LOC131332555 n=1 Tax=Rhododendron vialii TaxID=182163 RepID=UPI00265D6EA0|nr:uncharacterized protein LOC131332555 [Rhododendron vialii]